MPITTREVTIIDLGDGDATLVCPFCHAKDTIVEIDRGIRINRIDHINVHHADDGAVDVAVLRIYPQDSGEWETDYYQCNACSNQVLLPTNTDVEYD